MSGWIFHTHPIPHEKNDDKPTDVDCTSLPSTTTGNFSILFLFVYFLMCDLRWDIIHLDNGMGPTMRQAIIWTDDGIFQLHTWAVIEGGGGDLNDNHVMPNLISLFCQPGYKIICLAQTRMCVHYMSKYCHKYVEKFIDHEARICRCSNFTLSWSLCCLRNPLVFNNKTR